MLQCLVQFCRTVGFSSHFGDGRCLRWSESFASGEECYCGGKVQSVKSPPSSCHIYAPLSESGWDATRWRQTQPARALVRAKPRISDAVWRDNWERLLNQMFVMLCQGWWYNHSSKALAAAAPLLSWSFGSWKSFLKFSVLWFRCCVEHLGASWSISEVEFRMCRLQPVLFTKQWNPLSLLFSLELDT